MSARTSVRSLDRNQEPSRYTPGVAMPSPSQSPRNGRSVARPKCHDAVAPPLLCASRRVHDPSWKVAGHDGEEPRQRSVSGMRIAGTLAPLRSVADTTRS